MSILSRQTDSPFAIADWQADVVQRLDEQHLIAVSDVPRLRLHFGLALEQFLAGLRDAEVCTLHGQFITDAATFRDQLARALPTAPGGPPASQVVHGPRGITSLLRSRRIIRGTPASKLRFYIWHDADVLLAEDEALFARIVDAIAGVAAEAEYASDDMLLIHRAVYIGSTALLEYARSEGGAFGGWARDSEDDDPFWQLVSGIEAPPFARFVIDDLSR